MTGLTSLSATHLLQLIRSKQTSARELVEAHLRRIADVDPKMQAVVQVCADTAVAEAEAADAALARGADVGPLHGVPFTVKDWIETAGVVCAAGFEERREYVPKHDATTVARMRAAGAIMLGKTKPGSDADVYPRPNNPYDLERTPGGSSSGEAAIIAAGGSPLGLGSDSGGSLRWPAHCCGIVTLKPTNGLVPSTGHFPRIGALADPRTTIGPMARSVEDLVLALRVIAGPDGRDAGAVPVPLRDPGDVLLKGMRAAVYTEAPDALPTRQTVAAVRDAARTLADAGVEVRDARPPRIEEALGITHMYWARVQSISLNDWMPGKQSTLSGEQLERGLFTWDRLRRAFLGFMQDYELIVCPVAADAAPLHRPATDRDYIYMLPYSLTGYPVAVVRAGTSAEGMPLGVQIVARPWRDDVALAAAAQVEGALGGWRPPGV